MASDRRTGKVNDGGAVLISDVESSKVRVSVRRCFSSLPFDWQVVCPSMMMMMMIMVGCNL